MRSRTFSSATVALVLGVSGALMAACGGDSGSLPLPDNLPTRTPTSQHGAGPPPNAPRVPIAPAPEVLTFTGQCQPDNPLSESQRAHDRTLAFDFDPFCIVWADNSGELPSEYLLTLHYEHSGETFEHRVPDHQREFVFPAEEGVKSQDINTCAPRSDWGVTVYAVLPDSNVLVAGYGMGGRCELDGQTPPTGR